MVSFSSLSLLPDSRLIEALNIAAYEAPDRIFKGYGCTYYYKNFGYGEFSTALLDNSGSKELRGLSRHIMGYHNYKMKVVRTLDKSETGCLSICSPLCDSTINLLVSFVMSDVLPSILPGDTVYFQGLAFLYSGKFYSSKKEADKDKEASEERKTTGTEFGFVPKFIFFKGDGRTDPDGFTPIYTRVYGFRRYHSPELGNTICTVEADSPFGEVTIAVPETFLTPLIISRLERNKDVFMYGFIHFSGDVAIGEYQKGAVFDEAQLLRVLREALEMGDLGRLEKNMSKSCEYYGYNGRRLSGTEEIIPKMRDVLMAQHENEYDIAYYAVARVVEVLDPLKAEYEEGKECLLQYSINSKGRTQCIIFIDQEDGKISKMKFNYECCYRFEIDEETLNRKVLQLIWEIEHDRIV